MAPARRTEVVVDGSSWPWQPPAATATITMTPAPSRARPDRTA